MGTLILPPIHFNDQVYDSMAGLSDPSSGEGGGGQRRRETSSSGGSTRSPLDLPMGVTAGQTQRTMTASRAVRQRRHQAVGHVTKASGAQCEQTRRLFESALQRADGESLVSLSSSSPEPYFNYTTSTTTNSVSQQTYVRSSKDLNSTGFSFSTSQQSSLPSINDTLSSSALSHSDRPPPLVSSSERAPPPPPTPYVRSASCSIRARHNGPSAVGSPLYNKHSNRAAAAMTAAVPVVVSSAPSGSGRYNHERYWTRSPAAQTYMDRVSSAFRVVTTPRNHSNHHHHHTDDAASGSASKDRSGFLSLPPTTADYADILLMPADSDLCPEEYFRGHPALQPSRVADLGPGDEQSVSQPRQRPQPASPGHMHEGRPGDAGEDAGLRLAGPEQESAEGAKDQFTQELISLTTKEESVIPEPREEPVCLTNTVVESNVQIPQTPATKTDSKKVTVQLKSSSKTKVTRGDKREAPLKPTSAGKGRAAAAAAGGENDDAVSGSGSSSSGLPSRPSSAQYWRTKTWVDDATVTSTPKGSEQGDDAGGDASPNDPQQPAKCPKSPDVKPEVSFKPEGKGKVDGKGKPGGKNQEKQKPERGKSGGLKKAAEVTKQAAKVVEEEVKVVTPVADQVEAVRLTEVPVEVMNLNDLKRKRGKLPDFICPSSEDKSRESAVLDWLETTSIHWAMKTAPLL